MNSTITIRRYVAIIDTNQYSGNFERRMCAYITGAIGDCRVGEGMARLVPDKICALFFDAVAQFADDDNGCFRPCSMWFTPGQHDPASRSVAIFFCERPTETMLEVIKTRALGYVKEHAQQKIRVTGIRLIREEIWEIEEAVTVENAKPKPSGDSG